MDYDIVAVRCVLYAAPDSSHAVSNKNRNQQDKNVTEFELKGTGGLVVLHVEHKALSAIRGLYGCNRETY
jgi:hypothetical protein